jgi:hypothetical protein
VELSIEWVDLVWVSNCQLLFEMVVGVRGEMWGDVGPRGVWGGRPYRLPGWDESA